MAPLSSNTEQSTNWSGTLYIDGNAKTPTATMVGAASIAPGTSPDRMGASIVLAYSIITVDEIACWDVALQQPITELQSHYNLAQDSGNYTSSGFSKTVQA